LNGLKEYSFSDFVF